MITFPFSLARLQKSAMATKGTMHVGFKQTTRFTESFTVTATYQCAKDDGEQQLDIRTRGNSSLRQQRPIIELLPEKLLIEKNLTNDDAFVWCDFDNPCGNQPPFSITITLTSTIYPFPKIVVNIPQDRWNIDKVTTSEQLTYKVKKWPDVAPPLTQATRSASTARHVTCLLAMTLLCHAVSTYLTVTTATLAVCFWRSPRRSHTVARWIISILCPLISLVLWSLSTRFVKRDDLTGREVGAWALIWTVQVTLFAVSVREMDRFRVARLRAVVAYLLLPVGLALLAVLARMKL